MNRAVDIVKTLLDICEDLNTRLPGLLNRFSSRFSEEQIRQIAEADPTAGTSCEYTEWLLDRQLSGGYDSANADKMKDILTKYHSLKQKPKLKQRFVSLGGHLSIGEYKNATELTQHVELAFVPDFDENEVRAGTRPITKIGDLSLFEVTNFEAARKIAIAPGDPHAQEDFGHFKSHAGTRAPGWPYTAWCTQFLNHYNIYADAPLYVVKKGNLPYAQVSIGHKQILDIKDDPMSDDALRTVAPILAIPELEADWHNKGFVYGNPVSGWKATDATVKIQLKKLVSRWMLQQTLGYNDKDGKRVEPVTKDKAVACESFHTHYLQNMFNVFNEAMANPDAVNAQGNYTNHRILTLIATKIDAKPPEGIQKFYNYIYLLSHEAPPLETISLPDSLRSYAAFEEMFNDIVDDLIVRI